MPTKAQRARNAANFRRYYERHRAEISDRKSKTAERQRSFLRSSLTEWFALGMTVLTMRQLQRPEFVVVEPNGRRNRERLPYSMKLIPLILLAVFCNSCAATIPINSGIAVCDRCIVVQSQ